MARGPMMPMHCCRIAMPFLMALVVCGTSPPAAAARSADSDRDFTAGDLKGLAFRSVGPANMGGRVSAIALVPGSRTSFYVGYGTAGIFKTENLGVTFEAVFDKVPVPSIGALSVVDAPPDWPGWTEEVKEAGPLPAAKDSNPPESAEAEAGDRKDRAERGKGKIVWVVTRKRPRSCSSLRVPSGRQATPAPLDLVIPSCAGRRRRRPRGTSSLPTRITCWRPSCSTLKWTAGH